MLLAQVVVMEVGVENVVQVVKYNEANYALASKMLQERHPL